MRNRNQISVCLRYMVGGFGAILGAIPGGWLYASLRTEGNTQAPLLAFSVALALVGLS